jgi:hypothetical protein
MDGYFRRVNENFTRVSGYPRRTDLRWCEWEAKSIPEEGVIFAVARVTS